VKDRKNIESGGPARRPGWLADCRAGALDALEPRALLAAVAWTGGAGDSMWSTPGNWSGGVVPVNGDDVEIDAGAANPTIRFTRDAGSVRLNSLYSAEAMTFTGGELTVATSARVDGLVAVMGGAIGGGAWASRAGAITFAGSTPSRVVGPVTFQTAVATINTQVRVEGDLESQSTVTVNAGGMDFASDVSLDSGTFVMINSRLGLAGEGNRKMTIGPAVTVRGYGSLGGALFSERAVTTLVNQGTILADVSARYLVVAPVGAFASSLDNQGVIRASGGGVARVAATNLANYSDEASGTLIGGTWRADASSTLLIDYSRNVTVNAADIILGGANASFSNMMEQIRVNNGSIELGSGMQWTRYIGLANHGTITLESVSALSLPVGGVHSGTFVIGAGSLLTTTGFATFLPTSRIIGSGTLQITTGPLQLGDIFGDSSQVRLQISRNASVTLLHDVRFGSVENAGTVHVGTFRLRLSGAFTQLASGIVNIDVMSAERIGCIDAGGAVVMAGTMHADSSTGFDPSKQGASLFTAVLFRGSSFTGSFTTVTQITAASGAMSMVNTGTSLELWHNIADYNADGGVDGSDLESYLLDWEAGELSTDVNGDGGVDGGDIEAFITLWALGGR
jgi:hypothetical protein